MQGIVDYDSDCETDTSSSSSPSSSSITPLASSSSLTASSSSLHASAPPSGKRPSQTQPCLPPAKRLKTSIQTPTLPDLLQEFSSLSLQPCPSHLAAVSLVVRRLEYLCRECFNTPFSSASSSTPSSTPSSSTSASTPSVPPLTLVVFGSQSYGLSLECSDIDVNCYAPTPIPEFFPRLHSFLSQQVSPSTPYSLSLHPVRLTGVELKSRARVQLLRCDLELETQETGEGKEETGEGKEETGQGQLETGEGKEETWKDQRSSESTSGGGVVVEAGGNGENGGNGEKGDQFRAGVEEKHKTQHIEAKALRTSKKAEGRVVRLQVDMIHEAGSSNSVHSHNMAVTDWVLRARQRWAPLDSALRLIKLWAHRRGIVDSFKNFPPSMAYIVLFYHSSELLFPPSADLSSPLAPLHALAFFFHHYASIKWSKQVIRTSCSTPPPRAPPSPAQFTLERAPKGGAQAAGYGETVFIQDPVSPEVNLGRFVTLLTLPRLQREFSRASSLLPLSLFANHASTPCNPSPSASSGGSSLLAELLTSLESS